VLNEKQASGHNRAEWRKIHTPESIKPMVAKAIAALSAQGISKFAATGYCYGGKIKSDTPIPKN
jgi:dienelactone hydrolase